MASPVGTSFLDHFAALRDPRQGWKVVFPLSDDEAPRLEAPAEIDITTVILARKQPVGLGPATCVASEPETWTAFAILSGISSEALAGEQILIDQNAWLRAAWRPGEPGNLTNPQALAAVRSARGRRNLAAWLKYLENRSRNAPDESDPMATYDFTCYGAS